MAEQSNVTTEPNGRAVVSLVFGILGLVLCPVVGSIVAIVTGYGVRSGVAKAGVILGWIGLALSLLVGILMLVLVPVGLVASDADWKTMDHQPQELVPPPAPEPAPAPR